MNRILGTLLFLATPCLALNQPQRINFQGKLIDPTTNNPKTGPVSLTFNLYSVPTGGSSLYTETQNNVPLTNGVFSVEVGTQTALPRDLFLGASVYLGVTVVGDAAGEMVPRQNLVMSPYAFSANQLSDMSEVRLVAGLTYSTFTNAGNLAVPDGITASTGAFAGLVTVGTMTATTGVNAASGTFTNGVTASSGTFLATGGNQYSLVTSSGILLLAGTLDVQAAGGVTADYGIVAGSVTAAGGVTAASGTFTNGVTMSSATLSTIGGFGGGVTMNSTFTILASTFSVGWATTGSSFTVAGGSATIAYGLTAGSLSAGNFDWVFLSSATLSAAAATLTANIPATAYTYTHMKFMISWGAVLSVATRKPEIEFNADAATDYASQVSLSGGVATATASGTAILLDNANNNQAGFYEMQGSCVANSAKMFTFTGVRSVLAVTTAPAYYIGSAYWSNVTNSITSITLLLNGAGNYPAGTTIRVFGAL